MPNNITNRLRLEGKQEEINKVFDFIKATEPNKDGIFELIDFNTIIPMPQEIVKYGGWRDWRIAHWGTKWNAYRSRKEENTLFFLTAWGDVTELMKLLATKFPNVTFYYDYADEDIAYNVGSWIFAGNTVLGKLIADNSKEAYELCFELGKCDKDDYEFVDGTYQLKETEV